MPLCALPFHSAHRLRFYQDAITFPIFSKVPTGAVLLFTITLYPFMYRPIFSATDVMADISAQLLLSEGVPTAIKITSDFRMQSLIFVIKTILFSLAFRSNISFS